MSCRIEHFQYVVTDLEAAVRFYTAVFDWAVRRRGRGRSGEWAELGAGATFVRLRTPADGEPFAEGYKGNHLGIVTEDAAKIVERARELGRPTTRNVLEHPYRLRYYIRDFDNNELEIIQYTTADWAKRNDYQLDVDRAFMKRCLELARRAEGETRPNPLVGAVLVKDGEVLAEGWHEGPGLPHAEVAALFELERRGGTAEGATLYVNLEPCCHYGRTPPCTNAILRSGVRRVVAGMIDPNPLVRGRGIELLRAAGIEVVAGVEAAACRELNAEFVALHEAQKGAA